MKEINKPTKIVIFTDCYDIAFNEVYQTLHRLLTENGITDFQIDPVVAIPNFSITNASFQIRLLSEIYEPGTLFLVIMNALSNNPERIFGKTKNGIRFVGNNSGYFNWMFKDHGVDFIYQNLIDREKDGRSFGGKHVQVPTACKILSGENFENFGKKVSEEIITDHPISIGTVVHCDNFGLMKIFHSIETGLSEGQKILIKVNNKNCIEGIFSKHLKRHADGTWVLFNGSSLGGLPELGKVRCPNSAKELNIKVGDIITWEIL